MSNENLPRVKWLNSKTAGPVSNGPRVIHDGMPDGVYYEPTPEVVAQIIKGVEQAAQRKWFGP
jgi:hypothetical protein